VSRHHPSVLSLLEPSPRRACALSSSRWRRAAATDTAGDNSMLACARSRAGSSTCVTWAWPHRDCRHSLAQWPSLSQLWQASSRATLEAKYFRLSRSKTEYMKYDFSATTQEEGDVRLDGSVIPKKYTFRYL
jgi:hypothetical protein